MRNSFKVSISIANCNMKCSLLFMLKDMQSLAQRQSTYHTVQIYCSLLHNSALCSNPLTLFFAVKFKTNSQSFRAVHSHMHTHCQQTICKVWKGQQDSVRLVLSHFVLSHVLCRRNPINVIPEIHRFANRSYVWCFIFIELETFKPTEKQGG
jgi:hypothetical protein